MVDNKWSDSCQYRDLELPLNQINNERSVCTLEISIISRSSRCIWDIGVQKNKRADRVFLAVKKLCKLVWLCFESCAFYDFFKILWFFLEEFFPYFQTKILNYIFMTIFIFYEVLKRAVCFCSILVQLLINFDKEIRRQLHFLLIQIHLFKNTGNFFFT